MTNSSFQHKVFVLLLICANQRNLTIPFPTPLLASQALQVLRPDKELKEDQVKKSLSVEGSVLHVDFECVSARMARLATNSFLDSMELVVSSMADIGRLNEV